MTKVPFDKLGLIDPLLKVLHEKGYSEPTPIQELAIPVILDRTDILGTARTGSGKTATFVLPMLQIIKNIKGEKESHLPKSLILTPTRELAKQIGQRIDEYSTHLDINYAIIYGGVSQDKQEFYLERGVDVVIGTPGRIMDLMSQKILLLHEIEIFILDEADRMLDMGFIDDINKIKKKIPSTRQILLFSATMSDSIQRLAEEMLIDPEIIVADEPSTTVDTIDSTLYLVEERDKFNLLKYLLQTVWMDKILVFTKTRKKADEVAKLLYKGDYKVAVIHSEKTQHNRELALKWFSTGKIRILVATDVASRGIDIDDITHIINFEVPEYSEDYVHRVGRTGRAGREGTAYTFCAEDERKFLVRIENLIGQEIEQPKSYRFKSRIPLDRSKYDVRDQ